MPNVALVEKLDSDRLQKCIDKNIDIIIANRILVPLEKIPEKIRIFNSSGENHNIISWAIHKRNEAILAPIKSKYPLVFQYKGYDLTRSFLKQLIWAKYQMHHTLLAAFDHLKNQHPNLRIVDKSGLPSFKEKIKTYIQFLHKRLKGSLAGKNDYQLNTDEFTEKTYVFIIQNEFTAINWQNLINEFDSSEVFILLLCDEASLKKIIQSETYNNWQAKGISSAWINEPKMENPPNAGFSLVNFNSTEVDYLNTLLKLRGRFCGFIDYLETAFKLIKPQLVICNAFENSYHGHLSCELGRKLQFKVVNIMNGNKTAEANNANVEFDRWLVWDEGMRQMLIQECFLDEKQIFNAGGHLSEDTIRAHTYQGTLNDLPDFSNNPKYILYGSTVGLPLAKIRSLDTIYSLLKKQSNIFLILRPHPRERKQDYYLPKDEEIQQRVKVVEYTRENSKKTLYDQFLKVQLVISIGASTIIPEAMWAGVPAISYEESEKPSLYNVDSESIFFANNPNTLINLVDDLLARSPKDKHSKSNYIPVAQKYAQAIYELCTEQSSRERPDRSSTIKKINTNS